MGTYERTMAAVRAAVPSGQARVASTHSPSTLTAALKGNGIKQGRKIVAAGTGTRTVVEAGIGHEVFVGGLHVLLREEIQALKDD
jgi:hypothetical protein